MKKPVLGLVLGGCLGIFDGLSALVSAPETQPQIAGIVIGSTIKGLITGLAIGFFARKVNSLPLGVLFGLLVGLVLAWAVAAIPDESGKHYYWQIMLPGALLGTVVGFVTQRYGMRPRSKTAAVIASLLLCLGHSGRATAEEAACHAATATPAVVASAEATGAEPAVAQGTSKSAAAFETLKKLAGTWQGTAADGAQTFPTEVVYRLASGGSVVMETLFGGTSHEMISMYHLDGDALVMTHYCGMGNQPHMKLDAAASTADRLVFAFAGGTNFDPMRDPHVHNGEIHIQPDQSLRAQWTFYVDGKKEGTKEFAVTRKAP